MKKLIIIVTLITSTIANLAVAGGTDTEKTAKEKEPKAFHIDKLTAKVVDETVYFNVTLDRETERCIYSMVRFNADGSMESIGLKDGIKNPNNLPLLYSFKDTDKPKVDVEYALYRIGADSEVIARWTYEHSTGQLESQDINMLSQNPR